MTVGWRTEDMSAHSPADYEGGEGTIIFEHGEMTKMLEINIHDDQVSFNRDFVYLTLLHFALYR